MHVSGPSSRRPLVVAVAVLVAITAVPALTTWAQSPSGLCSMGDVAGGSHPRLNSPLMGLAKTKVKFNDPNGNAIVDGNDEIFVDIDDSNTVSANDLLWTDLFEGPQAGDWYKSTDAYVGISLQAMPFFSVRFLDDDGDTIRDATEAVFIDLGIQGQISVNDRYLAPSSVAGLIVTASNPSLAQPIFLLPGMFSYYDYDANAIPNGKEAVFWDVSNGTTVSVTDVCLSNQSTPATSTASTSSDVSGSTAPPSTSTTTTATTATSSSGICMMGDIAGASHPRLNSPLMALAQSKTKFNDPDWNNLVDANDEIFVDIETAGTVSAGDLIWTDLFEGPQAGDWYTSSDVMVGIALRDMPPFSVRFYDDDGDAIRDTTEAIFIDLGTQGQVSVHDRYLAPASMAGQIVKAGSPSVGQPIFLLPGTLRYYDANANGVPNGGEAVFWDLTRDSTLSVTDVCLSNPTSSSPSPPSAVTTSPTTTSTASSGSPPTTSTANPPPAAVPNSNFFWSPTDICAGEVVKFFAEEQGHKGDAWNIEGSYPQGASVTYSFAKAGTMSVSLTATSTGDTYSSTHKWIPVFDCSPPTQTSGSEATAAPPPPAATTSTVDGYEDQFGGISCVKSGFLYQCKGRAISFDYDTAQQKVQVYSCGPDVYFPEMGLGGWPDYASAGFIINWVEGSPDFVVTNEKIGYRLEIRDSARGFIGVTLDWTDAPIVDWRARAVTGSWVGFADSESDWDTIYAFRPANARNALAGGSWVGQKEGIWQTFVWGGEGIHLTKSARWTAKDCLAGATTDPALAEQTETYANGITQGKIGSEVTVRSGTNGVETQTSDYAGMAVSVARGANERQYVATIDAEGTSCKSVILKFDADMFQTPDLKVTIEDTSIKFQFKLIPTMESDSLEDAIDACQPGDAEAEHYVVLDRHGTQVITSFQQFSEKRVTVEAAAVGNILVPGPGTPLVIVGILVAVGASIILMRRPA